MSKPNKQQKPRSISRRFSFALIGVVTFMLVGFATVSILVNISRTNTKLESQLDNTLKLAETSLITPLLNFDEGSINDFAEALFQNESIVYFKILEDDSVIAVRVRPEFEQYDFVTLELSSRFLAKTSEIMHSGRHIGTVEIAMSRKSVQKEYLTQMYTIIALTAFIIAAIALTSIIITRRYISSPLLKLEKSTTLIANGDLDAGIDLSSSDGIGKLAYNLNYMRKSIKQLFEEITENQTILQDKEARIRAIGETAADGIITIDECGIVESCNPAAERMFSYKSAEMIGQNVSMFIPKPEDESDKYNPISYWQNSDGMSDGVREVVGIKKNGDSFQMDLAVSEVCLGDKKLFTGIMHDIAERIRSEKILADYNRTLKNDVANRTQELSNAINNLRATQTQLFEAEKMASLGGLVAGVAHEINTPIGIGVHWPLCWIMILGF